jgi:polar amino acid transport system ATP-binding protein
MMSSHPVAASETDAITLTRIEKRFGRGAPVLRELSFGVRRGEKVIMCGPSGSGKSTAVRCMNALEWPDAGEVRIGGVRLTRDNQQALRRRTAMVFQQFNLFPHMSALDNCMLGPVHALGLAPKEARERASRCLHRVQMGEHAAKFPAQLSGGQQQRVAIARALALEPQILLFDEPTSSLDPEMIQEVLRTMEDLAASGMTMVCVTHEMGFARHVADRIVFLDEGRILYDGAPELFFSGAGHERIRTFLSRVLTS